MTDFGERLQRALLDSGKADWSLRRVARESGVDYSSLHRWWSGPNEPNMGTDAYVRIGRAIGVPVVSLMPPDVADGLTPEMFFGPDLSSNKDDSGRSIPEIVSDMEEQIQKLKELFGKGRN